MATVTGLTAARIAELIDVEADTRIGVDGLLDLRISVFELVVINAQAGAYTLVTEDSLKAIHITNAGAVALTVPPNVDQGIGIGAVIEVVQMGTGAVTITAGAGVTLRSRGDLVITNGQYAVCSLRKIATDEWLIVGDLV